ncbi:PD-(D/E)XK nuclease-like domain-containing protein [Campylobacter sputorum]|uniref:PD-(D/E)XK nuclease-like domain-containing protein n=1 Tax=Campylobacter sputorum TaxID=206 RepID=UPI0006909E78|nr:PD-(D/E)XK nuclease-like domain-containing protein [Campylobacter sputorum]
MTNKEYHARLELSKSDLDLLAKSPYHFKHKNELRQEPTKALILGSAVHKLVLENDDFDSEFIIEPSVDKRTKDGRAKYKEFLDNCNDRQIITEIDYLQAKEMSDSILYAKETAIFLKDGKAEQSYFGEINGVKVRCRPDFYNEKLGVIVDLKTTSDASKTGFMKSVANFNYHIQHAFYTDILRQNGKIVNHFMFLVVENKNPYLMGFYELDDIAVNFGREQYNKLLDLYKVCLERDEWWGYVNFNGEKIEAVQTISLPTWKFYENIV